MFNQTFIRLRRYIERDGYLLIIIPIGFCCLGIQAYPRNALTFPLVLVAGFLLPYPFKNWLIRKIDTRIMKFLDRRFIEIGLGIGFLLLLLKQREHFMLEVTAAYALNLGIQFWTRTDEMYVMISWLAHPLEYGTPPDEISLLCKTYIDWNGKSEPCYVYRFRYGENISAGITRPIVFSLMDPMGDLSPVEVVEKYRQWYESDGRQALERDSSE